MFWFPFIVIGFLSNDASYYGIAFGIYLFFAQPLIPMWIIIPLTAWAILKLLDQKQTHTKI
jgi:Mn2+/Fe2+ NRAMP family transporter